MQNLAAHAQYASRIAAMDSTLKSVVDYPSVARDVATYGHSFLLNWTAANPDWRSAMAAPGLRWDQSWNRSCLYLSLIHI